VTACAMIRPVPSPLPLEIAAYARRGWRLFPCNGKKPFIKGWPQHATCDVSQIETWASQFVDCNWAAKTGLESCFFVLDLDGDEHRRWSEE